MKLKVIGWTYYDANLPRGENSWAACNAIVDEIKKHGYLFSGASHQDGEYCTPVLNNGRMYRFSQRGWGDIMAEAHGYTGRMDYVRFAFDKSVNYATEVRPQDYYDKYKIIPVNALKERFELEVPRQVLDLAQSSREVRLDDLPTLRYLDKGDTLALTCGKNTVEYTVAGVDRKKDLTEEKRLELQLACNDIYDAERRQRAEEELNSAKTIIIIKLA